MLAMQIKVYNCKVVIHLRCMYVGAVSCLRER